MAGEYFVYNVIRSSTVCLHADFMVYVSPHRFLIQTYASGKELSGFWSKEIFVMLCSKLFNELVFIIQVT